MTLSSLRAHLSWLSPREVETIPVTNHQLQPLWKGEIIRYTSGNLEEKREWDGDRYAPLYCSVWSLWRLCDKLQSKKNTPVFMLRQGKLTKQQVEDRFQQFKISGLWIECWLIYLFWNLPHWLWWGYRRAVDQHWLCAWRPVLSHFYWGCWPV